MMEQHHNPHNVFHKRQTRGAQATPEEEEMHEQAKAKYPQLALSPGEYVLEEVRRHPIGLFFIWATSIFLTLVMLALIPFYSVNMSTFAQTFNVKLQSLPTADVLVAPALILCAIFIGGGALATYVYNQNRFYLTTESIIQFVQYSLFKSKQQVVNLINVEDVSADQIGVLQHLLSYGTLRVSTQGEETIYHFQFVASPNTVVHRINDATEVAIQRLEGSNFPATELAA